ncbi:MAG: methionine--tRNA ligase subunit beta, partial [Candidatus Omnitrophica bacterium]|nr:methionine--tRNA ligase subunit beta [Candidatus Omnitrophota bacterium]
TNKYIVEREPWTLAKDPASKARLATIIYNLLESLRIIAVLITPFMPQSAKKIMDQIGIADMTGQNFDNIRRWGGLPPGSILTRGESLFPRVEFKKEEKMEEKKSEMVPVKAEISYEDFEKIDLRVAKVLAAEAVPKSSKLLKLKIDIGEERTIVAGMAKDYKPEEIVGKNIVVLVNLKPTKLMGVESHGMLLAADTDAGLTLVGFDRNPKTGARIR